MEHHPSPHSPGNRSGSRARYWLVFGAFVLIAGFFLLKEHRAHVWGVLPYLLLLACPLMHIFMHGGHGHHKSDGDERGHQHTTGGDKNA